MPELLSNFITTCPHCGTENNFFFGDSFLPMGNGEGSALLMCANDDCKKCIVVEFIQRHRILDYTHQHTISNSNNTTLIYVDHYPQSMARAVPDFLPERIKIMFQGAAKNHRQGDYWIAASSFRSVIDVATKTFSPELSDKKLSPRINSLRDGGQITPAMADWAHNVRMDGNDATHEGEQPSEEESEELMLFTETLLIYLFTMPEKVRLARERRSNQNTDT